jgi:sigma-E factor negative regulatory protein RseA
MKEEISALVDGETNDIERARTLRTLDKDPALRQVWERYHLVRTALRRELDVMASPGLSDRIAERLRNEHVEPTHYGFLKSGIAKYAGGSAIAAAVATIAILTLQPVSTTLSTAGNTSSAGQTRVAEATPSAPNAQQVLNPYLVRHGEYAPVAGMNGMISYVRVVGRTPTVPENQNAE